jgi:uncharacterized iron-regulated protein
MNVLARLLLSALGACLLAWAGLGPSVAAAQAAWLFGEQHDQPDHQRQTAEAVTVLAAEGRLQAVVLEMAERGRSTAALPPDADEARVREALAWNERGWPWAVYRDLVMSAVRAGVPVWGGNLSREALRAAMSEPRWDEAVPDAARKALREAIDRGHCGLLPPYRLQPMVRMQIARDRSLAEAVAEAGRGAGAEAVVVLVSGAVHASRETGVPLHLAPLVPGWSLQAIAFTSDPEETSRAGFDELWPAEPGPQTDHCAGLRRRGMPAAPAPVPAPAASTP